MDENNNLQKGGSGIISAPPKRIPETIKEKGQYVLAFSVIATMLLVAEFPMFVVIFFGIFAYFLWKTFSAPSRSETREIFEFYLAANDVLRDDERRWYGFEMQEVVNRGERVLRAMNGAPPLVYFTLGALYHKAGDYKSAVNHLEYVLENKSADEATYVYPSPELRNYVKVLRKIEREPAEAPLTSAAVRALERARRNRGKFLLEESREKVTEQTQQKRELAAAEEKKRQAELAEKPQESFAVQSVTDENLETRRENPRETSRSVVLTEHQNGDKPPKKEDRQNKRVDPFADRKPISEVLHDIYDKNIQ